MKLHPRQLFFAASLLFSFAIYAQQKTIQGIVTDFDGQPLPGVTIAPQNATTGTQTDFDGKYTITVAQDVVLVFSYFGFRTQEIETIGITKLDVSLMKEGNSLDDVIITASGIKREQKSLGTATTTFKDEKINYSGQSSIEDALKGKMAGVVVSNASTDPGASSGIILRGINSFFSDNNQPLYIVDGVPINNRSTFEDDLNQSYDFGNGAGDINPQDIEELTVLKGASATVLYGSRAANGAIIVTTKKGSSKRITVELNSNTTFSEVLRVPKYQNQFGQGWNGEHILDENGSWGPRFTNQNLVWGNRIGNAQKIKPFAFQEDQLRDFFTTGTAFNNHVAVSGAIKKTNARLSFSNRTADGIFPTDSDSNVRNTLQLSLHSEVKFLSFGTTVNYVNTTGNGIITGQGTNIYNSVLQVPNDISIKGFEDYTNDPFNSISNYFTRFTVTNPYFLLNEGGSDYQKERLYGSFYVDAKLNSWSNVKVNIGVDTSDDDVAIGTPLIDAEPGSPNDNSSAEQSGAYEENKNTLQQTDYDVKYSIDFDFNPKWNIQSHFGFNYNNRKLQTKEKEVSDLIAPGIYSFSNSNSTPIEDIDLERRRLIGIYNSTSLNYKDQLFITANVRNDWSSTLPKKNRSVFYGGVNSSWVFTSSFPALQHVINFGKLRASYGETGVDTQPYQVSAVFVEGRSNNQSFRDFIFPIGDLNAFEVGNRSENSNLKPERRMEFEIGTELSLLNNRVGIDFAYYDATVKNQILQLPIAQTTGFDRQTANVGTISNKGVEASLRADIFKNPYGFQWETLITYATNDAILKELDSRIDQINLKKAGSTRLVARVGEPIAMIEGAVPLLDPEGRVVVDSRGIPIADQEAKVYGDTQYDYTLGFTNTFSYKGVSLSFTIDSRQGGLMYSKTADITRFTGNSITTTFNDRNPFIIPNSVVAISDSEGTITGYEENTTAISRRNMDNYYSAEALERNNVIDKSFVKLREVVLRYNFSKKLLDRIPLTHLSLAIVGRNLLLFTPSDNQYIDPEVSTFGTDLRSQFGEFSGSPSTRSISLNLNLKF